LLSFSIPTTRLGKLIELVVKYFYRGDRFHPRSEKGKGGQPPKTGGDKRPVSVLSDLGISKDQSESGLPRSAETTVTGIMAHHKLELMHRSWESNY
jgi:hypothetical protein